MILFNIAAQFTPLTVAINKLGAVPRAPSQTIASQVTYKVVLLPPTAGSSSSDGR
jgi:hypothetical protein